MASNLQRESPGLLTDSCWACHYFGPDFGGQVADAQHQYCLHIQVALLLYWCKSLQYCYETLRHIFTPVPSSYPYVQP